MRYGVFVIVVPAPKTHWVNDGGQDGDRWEGSYEEATRLAQKFGKERKPEEGECSRLYLVMPAP